MSKSDGLVHRAGSSRQGWGFSAFFAVAMTLWLLNETLGYEPIGLAVSVGLAVAVFALLGTGRLVSAFIANMLFTLTALEFPRTIYSGEDLFTYRTLQIAGASVSSWMAFAVFIWVVLFTRSTIGRVSWTVVGLAMFILAGMVNGLIGVVVGNYMPEYTLSDAQYYLVVLLGAVTATILLRSGQLQGSQLNELLMAVLASRAIVAFGGSMVFITAGASKWIPLPTYDALEMATVCLIPGALVGTRRGFERYILWVAAAAAAVNATLFNPSGKNMLALGAILVVSIILVVLRQPLRTGTWFVVFALGASLAVAPLIVTHQRFQVLRALEIQQALSLLSPGSLLNLDTMPLSPRVRVLEFLSVLNEYRREPVTAILGRGFGSFIDDSAFPVSELDVTAYSLRELESGKYVGLHDSPNTVLLKFGFAGLAAWGMLLVRVSAQLLTGRLDWVGPRVVFAVLWALLIGFSVKVGYLTGVLYAAVFLKRRDGIGARNEINLTSPRSAAVRGVCS